MTKPFTCRMSRRPLALAALALASASLPAAATEVGVSIGVSQPGFYGRIDIGGVAVPPVLVYPQPVVIAPPRAVVVQQPIYLRVPPGHARHWAKHCAHYEACGRPVYFVQEDWYQRYYVNGSERPRGKGHGHDKRG
jgi:hypothetical protein